MLSHLVYVSVRKPNCTEEEIEKILASCKKNNIGMDVTGVLIYSKTNFVQYIEGEYKQISSLYDKIKGDDRHKNTVLISSSPITQRTFPSWQMGSRKFDAGSVDFKTTINEADQKIFNDILAGKNADASKSIALIRKFFK